MNVETRYIKHIMEIISDLPAQSLAEAQIIAEWPEEYLSAARRCIAIGYLRKGPSGMHLKTFHITAKGAAYLKALKGDWTAISLLVPK